MVPQAPFDDLAAAHAAAAPCAEVNGHGAGHSRTWLQSRKLIYESLPAYGPSAPPTNRTPVHPGYGDR
jgi:hypothetical protein